MKAWLTRSIATLGFRRRGPAYAKLSISVRGSLDRKNLGLYALVENPDANWAKERFDTKKGLILKPVTKELFASKGTDWTAYDQAYDPKTDITQSQMKRVYEFAQLVTGASDEEFARQLPKFWRSTNSAAFMAVTVWLSSTDSILMMGQNFIVYLHPETDKFILRSMGPWIALSAISLLHLPRSSAFERLGPTTIDSFNE
jgi:spore coat protein CotH